MQTELKRFLEKQYGLTVLDIRRIQSGVMNINYEIKTAAGKYIFRIHELRNVRDVAFTVEMLQALSERKFPSPRLVASKSGLFISLIHKKPCLLYLYIEGRQPAKCTNDLMRQTGFLLGRLHRLLRNFRPRAVKPTWDPKELLVIVKKNKDKMLQSKIKGAEQLMDFLGKELLRFQFPRQLPIGLTHQDVKPENIISQAGKIQAIIDFDNSYRGVLLHDLTTPIIWMCFEKFKLNFQFLNSYLKGYSRARKLSALEKKNLLPAIKFRLLREAFIGPFAIYPYPERSQKQSEYFLKLYKKFYNTTADYFYENVKV